MKKTLLPLTLGAILFTGFASTASAQTRIGEIGGPPPGTAVPITGKGASVLVERYDDPSVANVSCYIMQTLQSRNDGVAKVEYSISCRSTDSVKFPSYLTQGERVDFVKSNYYANNFAIYRWVDREKHTLIYTMIPLPGSSENTRAMFVIPAQPAS